MLEFLTQNIGTIAIGLAVAGLLTLITIKVVKDRKKGGCGCGCENCAMKNACHQKK